MGASVARQASSVPVRSSDADRHRMAKAHLDRPTSDFSYGAAIWDVLWKGHGSVKAAGITMGNTDPSQLKRQICDGTIRLKDLFGADDKALALLGQFLLDNFGDATKSKAQVAREKIPELLAAILDLVDGEAK